MWRLFQIVLFALTLSVFFACKKKDLKGGYWGSSPCLYADYNAHSNDTFMHIQQHMIGTLPIGPFQEYPEGVLYQEPVFNPNSQYEFIYCKNDPNSNAREEIWKFSFCTGTSTFLADTSCSRVDWSSKGWILFQGPWAEIFKVKDNGDSTTLIWDQGSINVGKWNPTGNYFWNEAGVGIVQVIDDNGSLITEITSNYDPIDWINDTTLIGVNSSGHISSMNIFTEVQSELNNNYCPYTTTKIYDPENICFFVFRQNGTGQNDHFIRYKLDGSNSLDTILNMYDSYQFIQGDVMNNKIITTLYRQFWKDSLTNTFNVYGNVLLMNADGTEPRMVNLP